MANTMLAATGQLPDGGNTQKPKPIAKAPGMPLANAGAPPSGAPLAQMASGPTMTQSPLASAQQNSPDPMAFATAPMTPPPVNTNTTQNPGASLAPAAPPGAPTQAITDFTNYSPIQAATAGLEGAAKEKAITDYWAGQNTKGLAGVGNSFNDKGVYDPAMNAAATAKYKTNNAGAIADITKNVQGGQSAAFGKLNDATQQFDRDQSLFDAVTQMEGDKARGASFDDEAAWLKRQTATPFGEPANNPNATPGLPAGYVPGVGVPTAPTTNTGGAFGTPTAAPSGPAPGVNATQIDPDNSLLTQQFTPSNDVDRTKVFQDSLNSTIKNVIDPAYETSARNLNRYNFGAGRGVSGMARTSQGDLASERERRIADLTAQGTADATRGSIDDMYRNLDELQQERGYQTNRSDTAFDQAVTNTRLEDDLTNSAFGRAERQSNAGEARSPADISLILSKIFGDQSSGAADAAARLFGGIGQKSGGGGGGFGIDEILKYIQSLGGGSGNMNPVVQQVLDRGVPGVQTVGG